MSYCRRKHITTCPDSITVGEFEGGVNGEREGNVDEEGRRKRRAKGSGGAGRDCERGSGGRGEGEREGGGECDRGSGGRGEGEREGEGSVMGEWWERGRREGGWECDRGRSREKVYFGIVEIIYT